MKNIMTFDVEEWYHSNLSSIDGLYRQRTFESRVEEPTYRILELLERTGNHATFFVLGMIAEKHKQLLRDIHDSGHEIASHGFAHELIYDTGVKAFRQDVSRGVKLLEDIVGEKVIGYRAPSWSVPDKAPWFWEVLLENGIQYDSSRYPFQTYLYGSNHYPRHSHWIYINGTKILEWPPSVLEFLGRRVPFSGGFYFRALPKRILMAMIRRFVRSTGEPVVLYLHPWETDVRSPEVNLTLKDHLIHRLNIKGCEKKLTDVLTAFQFCSFREKLKNTKYSASTVVMNEAESNTIP